MPDVDELETRVAQDRAQLAHSLDRLTDTVSPERLTKNINATAREYSGEIGRQAYAAARSNPAAFALVGAGLALLLTGGGTARSRSAPQAATPETAMDGFDERVAKADAQIKAKATGRSFNPTALRMRAALDRGLEKLPSKARNRVLSARKKAIEAQERVEAEARRVARKSKQLHNDQPLAVGAVAFGIGAVIGALLPGTRTENEWLGAKRDALMAEARMALAEEMDALHATASESLQKATGTGAATHRGP